MSKARRGTSPYTRLDSDEGAPIAAGLVFAADYDSAASSPLPGYDAPKCSLNSPTSRAAHALVSIYDDSASAGLAAGFSVASDDADAGAGASAAAADAAAPPPEFPPLFYMPPWPYLVLFAVLATGVTLSYTIFRSEIESTFGVRMCVVTEVGSLPLISIAFTYIHVYFALWLTFYPVHYTGCLRIPGTNAGLGWQGIVPFKAPLLARRALDLMTRQLVRVDEMFSRVDPVAVSASLAPLARAVVADAVPAAVKRVSPQLWLDLPEEVRRELCARAAAEAPAAIRAFFEELRADVRVVFDINDFFLGEMMKDKELLNQIFIRCGHAELRFIRSMGAWMGGFFGLLQAILYIFYDDFWVLPVSGLLVGCFTNWIVLKMIFWPVEPIRLCCGAVTLHGLFLARQREVALEYGRTLAAEVLTARNITAAMLTGPRSGALFSILARHCGATVDATLAASPLQSVLGAAAGPGPAAVARGAVTEAVATALPEMLRQLCPLIDEALDMRRTLSDRLGALSSEEFERMLHPVFEEDEWKLVLLGGVLAVGIGILQTTCINTGC